MSVELIRKPITLDEMVKTESVQVIKERDMIVPDGKPDMESIVQLDGQMSIDQIDVNQDRIMYRGKIDVNILYTTNNSSKVFYTMKGSIPVEDFIILEGVDKNQKIDFNYEVEHMSYNILNERKINVKAIQQIEVKAKGNKESSIITEVKTEEAVQVREEELQIVSLGLEKEDKMMVKEDLTVASSKPSVGEILNTCIKIQEEQMKRTETELKYNGILEITNLYKASGDDEDIEMVTHRVPFEGSIECIKQEEEIYWGCELGVEPSYMQIAANYDGEDKVIESEMIVSAKLTTYNKAEYELITDLYCPGQHISTKEKKLEYMNLLSRVSSEAAKKEAIAIETEVPEDMEVFRIDIKPTIEDKIVEGDRLTLKGILEIKSVALGKSEESNKIITNMNVIPFTQDLTVDNIPNGSVINCDIKVKDVKLYSQTKKEMVIEYVLNSTADIYKQDSLSILEEIELEEMSKEEVDQYPSMTVYQIKKSDTLWDLAKRFNTTVKDIEEVNDMETGANLREGQKIIILKKVKF